MPWSNHEITQTLHSYFQMLALEINQTPYSKAAYRRALQQRLNDRSESAIEFKHQNISAILIKYGRPYILGYKPRTHYQQSLEPAVLEYLATNKQLEQDFDLFASSDQLTLPDHVNFQNWLQDRPNPATSVAEPSTEYKVRINKTNYLEIEQTNRRLRNRQEVC
ncbi:MAG: hypothetical protein R3D58_20110 [Saprospiraceae bacterium]